ncbi:MAG TPA: response regulator [Vicinamibacterales bacterium]|jgi:DNA-binding response OmpR family regulator|nr:response regulator [Vicinamibacterales bacterium]
MAYLLVVDDDPSIRTVLNRRLTQWGYEVKEASSATEALEMMMVETPAIVLLDINMPGHDGLWLAERIRAKWTGTPIIMVSGKDDLDVVQRAQKLGAIDFVRKPFDREILRQALLRAAMVLTE